MEDWPASGHQDHFQGLLQCFTTLGLGFERLPFVARKARSIEKLL